MANTQRHDYPDMFAEIKPGEIMLRKDLGSPGLLRLHTEDGGDFCINEMTVEDVRKMRAACEAWLRQFGDNLAKVNGG